MSDKWEYKVEKHAKMHGQWDSEYQLNLHGDEGWELAGCVATDGIYDVTLIFKRPVQEEGNAE